MRSTGLAVLLAVLLAPASALAAGETGQQRAKEAAAALQQNEVARAIELYTEALGDAGLSNDRRAALLNDRGVAQARLGRIRAAIEDFNRSAQLIPENPSVYNNRGNVLMTAGLVKEAVKDFDRALLLAPGYAAAYSNRANALARLGEPEAAIADFTHAARLAPQSPAPLNGRGRLHLAQNRPHAAVRDFNRAIARDARFAAGYRARAQARVALQRYDEAIEDLSRAVAFDAANIEIYLLRGYCYLAARNVSSAIKDFARATELDARSHAAFEGLALAHAKAEAHDDALNQLARALEIAPRSAQAYAYRAVVYKWMGQPDLGAKDLERAVKFGEAEAAVLWARGELAEAAGNVEEAVAEFRKAVAAGPLLRDAASGLERLGAAAEIETQVRELAFERWAVVLRQGRYYAVNPEIPRLSVPLEMMGEGTPRLVAWDTRTSGNKTIAVLHFLAGQGGAKTAPEEIEHAAVVDLAQRSVIAIESVRQGARRATWDWEADQLTVTDIDGYKESYALRPSAPKDVAQQPAARRPVRTDPGAPKFTDKVPGWAPWAQQGYGPDRRASRPSREKPKTLFDLIFKSN